MVAWFVTGLRREAVRLTKKHRRMKKHELLILNEQLKGDTGVRPWPQCSILSTHQRISSLRLRTG